MTSRTDNRGVVEVLDAESYRAEHVGADVVTCGACGRSWDDSVGTAWTPAPSARCPFEDDHEITSFGDDLADPDMVGSAEYREIHDLVINAESPEMAEGICEAFIEHAQEILRVLRRGERVQA